MANLAVASFLLAADCGESTAPAPPRLEPNTMAIRVRGALAFDRVRSALGGFQLVSTGLGDGIHLRADTAAGLPLLIHLPGRLGPGVYPTGRWNPARSFVRQAEGSGMWVSRKPSVSFDESPAAALGHYASLPGGTLEIDEMRLPPYPDFFGTGSITGRLRTRAAADPRLVPPGTTRLDTVSISVEFRVALEAWPDGRAMVEFTDGPFAGTAMPALVGSGTVWQVEGAGENPFLVVGAAALPPESSQPIQLWFGTRMQSAGAANLQAIDADATIRPAQWSDHFAAGSVGGRVLRSLGGVIQLDSYQPYTGGRWGEARGSIAAAFELEGLGGAAPEIVHAAITFHVPVGFFVRFGGAVH